MRLRVLLLSLAPSLFPGAAACIQWTPCVLGDTPLRMECASLAVPLDYTDPASNATTLKIQLQRAPARFQTNDTKSILLNFGGPGADGIADFVYFGERMQAATGGGHHLINVVPRGTNDTLPFSCFTDNVVRQAELTPLAGNASDVALGFLWAKANLLSERCAAVQNKTGRLIGTAFVARDMMRVVDALGEDGMLRYWGVSYGTVLGATLAAMFPNRVDRVVLDGVVNPFEYYANRETELFADSDAVFRGFLRGCVANKTACALASTNQTAKGLERAMYNFFQKLKFRPMAYFPPGTERIAGAGLLVDYSLVKAVVYGQLYLPFSWGSLASCLAALVTGNSTSPAIELSCNLTGGSAGNTSAAAAAAQRRDQEALLGIKCSDLAPADHAAPSFDDMLPVFKGRHAKSRFFGDIADYLPASCAQWHMPAKERYSGNFDVVTRNPLLVIGNTHDPITPLVSAKNVSETFKGSVLLQHDAYGHDSLVQASLCTAKAIRSYFTKGQLPSKGTKCDVKVPLFSGSDGWTDVIAQLNKGG